MKGQIEILDEKPFIADAEIERMMDFDGLMDLYQQSGISADGASQNLSGGLSSAAKMGIISSALVGVSIVMYLTIPSSDVQQHIESVSMEPVEGVTVEEQQAPVLVMPPLEETAAAEKVEVEPSGNAQPEEEKVLPPIKEDESKQVNKTNLGYQPASPANGYEHLYEYFNSELQYPEVAVLDAMEGTLEVQFSVTAQGEIQDIQLMNTLGEAIDAQAIKILKNMPAWQPATLNGRPIKSKLSIPLSFGITKKE